MAAVRFCNIGAPRGVEPLKWRAGTVNQGELFIKKERSHQLRFCNEVGPRDRGPWRHRAVHVTHTSCSTHEAGLCVAVLKAFTSLVAGC